MRCMTFMKRRDGDQAGQDPGAAATDHAEGKFLEVHVTFVEKGWLVHMEDPG